MTRGVGAGAVGTTAVGGTNAVVGAGATVTIVVGATVTIVVWMAGVVVVGGELDAMEVCGTTVVEVCVVVGVVTTDVPVEMRVEAVSPPRRTSAATTPPTTTAATRTRIAGLRDLPTAVPSSIGTTIGAVGRGDGGLGGGDGGGGGGGGASSCFGPAGGGGSL